MKKAKVYIKKFVRAVVFFLIIGILLSISNFMFMPKNNSSEAGMRNPNARGFYGEKTNSIDTFIIGNSDAYAGFSPLELWHSYGFTSYVSGEGRERTAEAVNILNEVINGYKPKLIIFETDEIFTSSSGDPSLEITDILDHASQGLFPVLKNHDRWKYTSCANMFTQPKYTWKSYTKGQYISNKVAPYVKQEYMNETDYVEPIQIPTLIYLNRFVSICKSNNIPLLFIEVPSASSWSYGKHNAVAQYAEQHGITFLDFDLDRDKFDFDWKTDTRDKGNHLNSRGARKVTLYLGQYLSEHFNLQDHRNDKKLSKEWYEDYRKYLMDTKI